MFVSENLLLIVSTLVFFAILISKVGSKLGVPSMLLFLILGMIAGSEGFGLEFENYHISEFIGHSAMAVILFTGGLQTSLSETKPIFRQGVLLSTLGVVITIALTGSFIWFFASEAVGPIGGSVLGCLMLAAIVCSTDSASVFSVLHGKRIHLREHAAPLLELESGSNDPIAYTLTILAVQIMLQLKDGSHPETLALVGHGALVLFMQMAIGTALGLLIGNGATWLLGKIKLQSNPLYGIMVLSIAFFTNGLTNLVGGNGLLALYIAAIIIGNKAVIPGRKDVFRFFDGLTWLMQLLMFLMLGILAKPRTMVSELGPALLIALFIMLVARPLGVFLTLGPGGKFSARALTLISWVGLKGAGPILFAICPVIAGLDGSSEIFNIVFIISLLSLIVQGTTLLPMAKLLKLSYEEDPEVETFGMELPEEMGMLRDHTVSEEELAQASTLRDFALPHGIRVMMVRREGRFLVPHGSMKLQAGDHLILIIGDSDD